MSSEAYNRYIEDLDFIPGHIYEVYVRDLFAGLLITCRILRVTIFPSKRHRTFKVSAVCPNPLLSQGEGRRRATGCDLLNAGTRTVMLKARGCRVRRLRRAGLTCRRPAWASQDAAGQSCFLPAAGSRFAALTELLGRGPSSRRFQA